jgi:hypothetical protein
MTLTKFCPACQIEKDVADFGINQSRIDGLQSQCRSCKKVTQNKWYKKHKFEHQERTRRRRYNHRDDVVNSILKYFRTHPCIDCGENDPLVLEFDHVRGQKKCAIQDMVNRGYRWETIMHEIGKCEVRCANCHRRKTARDFSYRKTFLLSESRSEF